LLNMVSIAGILRFKYQETIELMIAMPMQNGYFFCVYKMNSL